MRAKTAVVLGAQWGDEGKGKIVDVLMGALPPSPATPVATTPGTPSSSTGKNSSCNSSLRRPPPQLQSHHRQRVVLDPIAFLKEVAKLRDLGVDVDGQLHVSNRAQVILPYHRMIELAAESAPAARGSGRQAEVLGQHTKTKWPQRPTYRRSAQPQNPPDTHRKRCAERTPSPTPSSAASPSTLQNVR